MQEKLVSRAKELLSDGTVVRVLGWRKGDTDFSAEPAFFESAESLDEFTYDGFCGANLSKYMIKASKEEGKTLVFLKPCDTYSFNQLIKEHRVDREKTYIVGVGCDGKLDIEKIREAGCKGITAVTEDGDTIKVATVYGDKELKREDVILERCKACKGGKHVAYDELAEGCDEEKPAKEGRFELVEKLEAMAPEERFAFWQNELSRCIRCNACRNVCPACSCIKCVFDNDRYDTAQKANTTTFEEQMFHIIRAFHVAGRCTDCGECSRVCPQHIPLHLLNRKFIKDIDEFYGEYQAGEDTDSRAPLTNFTQEDVEPSIVKERGSGMYQISREKMPELLAAVAKEMDLFLPVQNNGITNFGFWTEDAKVDLDTLKTVKSPKDAFFPQSEVLYSCYQKANKTSIEPAALKDAPFAIFGVRPCDVRAFDVLDRVFLSEPADVYYAARREHGIVVSLACHEPEDSCFCKTFGIDAAEPQADVAMWQVADGYAWEAKTEKGEKLTELVKEYLTEQDLAKEVEAEKEAIRTLIDKMPNSNLSLEGWGVGKTKERFDDPKWKELSDACLGCGTCTFSCPTCQCYDIKDFNTGNGVQRYRCWDSCMYSDFTMMAAGNNRTTQMQRFRQRFMHKLVYFPDNNDGMYSCVGCGRCVEKCPQSLNIVKVIKRMGGTK